MNENVGPKGQTIRLTGELWRELKEVSEKTGVPMATLIREGISLRLSKERERLRVLEQAGLAG